MTILLMRKDDFFDHGEDNDDHGEGDGTGEEQNINNPLYRTMSC